MISKSSKCALNVSNVELLGDFGHPNISDGASGHVGRESKWLKRNALY